MRFELTAFSLARRRSTTELHRKVGAILTKNYPDAKSQTRTGDTFIFSEVLYRLSYLGG
jgi:hypothetical protein